MHRFRVTRRAKWAEQRQTRQLCILLLQGDKKEEGLRGGEGAVGGSDKTGDMGAGGRHLNLQYTAASRVETSPQSGSLSETMLQFQQSSASCQNCFIFAATGRLPPSSGTAAVETASSQSTIM